MDKGTVMGILDRIREIKGNCRFYDLHVHPFEVMYAPLVYYPSSGGPGLYGTGSAAYHAPEISAITLDGAGWGEKCRVNDALRAKVAVLNSRRVYAHTGRTVLGDLMELASIDEALLLPVAHPEADDDGQMVQMHRMFGGDARFHFGYCLPNCVPNDRIVPHLQDVAVDFPIWAIKIHPAVTGIDLSTQEGRERVEAILEASRRTGLKVVVHGGLSPDCAHRENVAYGTVGNLQRIDWGITPETVIVAHAGCYGYPVDAARNEVLPLVERLLKRYPHLKVDTSGTNVDVLEQILIRIGPRHIVFGSDALYETPWSAMVKLWCALKAGVRDPEEGLLQIAGLNPAELLYGLGAAAGSADFPCEGLLTHQA